MSLAIKTEHEEEMEKLEFLFLSGDKAKTKCKVLWKVLCAHRPVASLLPY